MVVNRADSLLHCHVHERGTELRANLFSDKHTNVPSVAFRGVSTKRKEGKKVVFPELLCDGGNVMHHIKTFFLYVLERNVSEKGMQCCIQTVNIVKKL